MEDTLVVITGRKKGFKLDRSAHPFAYVFDKKETHAAAAAGGDSKPNRTEDYWEIDPDAAMAIRHHVYPRKRLYVPSEDDIKMFPTLGTQRITEMSDGASSQDDYNVTGPSRKGQWWTGQTLFPITETSPGDFSVAAAARKGRPFRSKTDAKREAKQQRFKSTDTIVQGSRPIND